MRRINIPAILRDRAEEGTSQHVYRVCLQHRGKYMYYKTLLIFTLNLKGK